MSLKEAVSTDKAPPPMPFFSQAIKCQGMVYCSGSIGMDASTMKLVEGSVADRTEVCLKNLAAILEAAGSSIDNVVKVNVFLTDMANFAAMNAVYDKVFHKAPKPVRTCVAVHQLPLGTDVEIECTAHQGISAKL
ncbi:endoribonuclease l-psp-like protein [Coleophoma crateriformis]|uniref:Endoribonuclease l-psp-like protein n=2 Tax=Coleophoma TaxID=453209 RepID=A0A3D8RGF5_9HELO|nr:endoribonuclease l-psp-like protein [Coleophoma cylindrospora]RDW87654.1 endoribonuclease l-psp-like protein [Coleophoma crateriformis]